MKKQLFKSYAKINLYLDVKNVRDDGYHELDMVMIPLELHDSILVSELTTSRDSFVTLDDYSLIGFKDNIVQKAVNILTEKYNFNHVVEILVHKNIPMKAGLGGGSSNAGTVLRGINNMYNLKISDEELEKIGLSLGADVPFFFKETSCRAQGIGEILTPIKMAKQYHCLLVFPNEGCSTPEVYKKLDSFEVNNGNIDNVIKALETGDDELLEQSIHNDLEPVAISLVPDIQVVKDKLREQGLKIVLMTGSGSCVFALSSDKKLIKKAEKALENDYRVEVTKTFNR